MKKAAQFKVRVVYGFLKKLEIVLLGQVLKKGRISEGMQVQIVLNNGTPVGDWAITEVLKMDFVNELEDRDFIGLMLKCKSRKEFELLRALRVYDEIVEVVPKEEPLKK
ncbi:MAG: hypothetical protein GY810_17010 [Aureispira sp.]|nr:hypothetical protein [Aureispira sp.]